MKEGFFEMNLNFAERNPTRIFMIFKKLRFPICFEVVLISVPRWRYRKVNLSEHGSPQPKLQEFFENIKCHRPTMFELFAHVREKSYSIFFCTCAKKFKHCRAMTFDVHKKLL